MEPHIGDLVFSGSIPELYDDYLVPLIFESHAADLAARLAAQQPQPKRVLEIAAGTGVVTRALAAALPAGTSIVATDLNQAMLDHAARRCGATPIVWRRADAHDLPFDDACFDAVVCQFGVMFFADKLKAFAQARRVLAPGGVFLFNVWDRIEDNEFAEAITDALASAYAHSPPRFLARTPHGYHDPALIRRDLVAGGFDAHARIATLSFRSQAANARIPAIAYCQGTPLRNEIEALSADGLAAATDMAARAIEQRFGSGSVDGKIQGHVVMVDRA